MTMITMVSDLKIIPRKTIQMALMVVQMEVVMMTTVMIMGSNKQTTRISLEMTMVLVWTKNLLLQLNVVVIPLRV